jgi:hypothetical protein
MTAEGFRYAGLNDEQLAAELKERLIEMKKLLVEVRDILKEASSVE